MFKPHQIKSLPIETKPQLRVPKMSRSRISPAQNEYFNDWDRVLSVTCKDGTKGKRYILDQIPSELVGFWIPTVGRDMGRITKSDVGRKLTVDVTTNDQALAYIE